ncbi:MAG TPA: RNA polymerase sigma-70 factor [Solirubrobacteraceae bacterium]
MSAEEDELEELRRVSFAIAYRMLGSVSEAEDVVQEALLRVHQVIEGGEQIASPRAYVATVTTRLAINELRSARARRERYVGEWLPEPILTDGVDDPAQHAEMADSLSLAMLVLLESLSAEQRAALLLHDVFDYGYREIAEIIGKSEDNVRQLASRARRHVEQRRPRFQASREQREELTQRFLAAAEQGDLAGLEVLLTHDVVLTGDGGGKVPALARSLRGRNRVARMLLTWMGVLSRVPGSALRPSEVNGGPGVIVVDGQQRLISVWSLEIAGGEVRSIGSVVNPDKLAHLGVVADFAALVRAHRPRPDTPIDPQADTHNPGGAS